VLDCPVNSGDKLESSLTGFVRGVEEILDHQWRRVADV
jgi:hypothetical protein